MYVRNGQPFDINIPQLIDDMQYPIGWFYVAANREALGITEDDTPPPPEDVEPLRAPKNLQINQWREAANFSTFPHQGKLIACDTLSRSDIDGVANTIALTGNFPIGFPMAWKATDNTYIPLPDLDAFKAMYASMATQGAQNFTHSQALKAQLAAATTSVQIAAIVW